MEKYFKKSLLVNILLAVGFIVVSGQTHASLSSNITVGFESDTRDGRSMRASVFPKDGEFYYEDSIVHSAIGFGTPVGFSVGNGTGASSHIHGNSTGGSRVSEYEADAGGGLFFVDDRTAFSFTGLDIAELNLELTDGNGGLTGSTSTITFRGYTSADYSSWHDVIVGADVSGNVVDEDGGIFGIETGAGINGEHLNFSGVEEFGMLYLVEYWFDEVGRGEDPKTVLSADELLISLDNVEFGAPIPVPSAIYLFGTALIGFVGMRKKNVAGQGALSLK